MTSPRWISKETNTHQDHVIAHVIGAGLRGYLIFDEALYLLLDIGFLWTLFIDGEMNLLPHPVTVSELEIDEPGREQIKADIELLLRDNSGDVTTLLKRLPDHGEIKVVSFFEAGESRRWLLECEKGNVAIETSLTTAEFEIHDC